MEAYAGNGSRYYGPAPLQNNGTFPKGQESCGTKYLIDIIKYKAAKRKMEAPAGLSRKWGWRILSFHLGEKAQEVFGAGKKSAVSGFSSGGRPGRDAIDLPAAAGDMQGPNS